MAKLKPYQETINLGKKIVSEFSDEEVRDTTLKWMAHYIAELINAADQEKSLSKKRKLQQECASIIEDIWKKRAYFPGNTRPLSKIGEVIPILKALINKKPKEFSWGRFTDYENDTHWGEFIQKIRHSMDNILKLSLCAVIGEQAFGKEKDWLKHAGKLSNEEREIIKLLEQLIDEREWLVNIIIIQSGEEPKRTKPSTDTITLVFDKISEIISNQNKYLDDLTKKIRPLHPVNKRKKGT